MQSSIIKKNLSLVNYSYRRLLCNTREKNMKKKLFSLLIVAILAISLCACENNDDVANESTTVEETTVSETTVLETTNTKKTTNVEAIPKTKTSKQYDCTKYVGTWWGHKFENEYEGSCIDVKSATKDGDMVITIFLDNAAYLKNCNVKIKNNKGSFVAYEEERETEYYIKGSITLKKNKIVMTLTEQNLVWGHHTDEISYELPYFEDAHQDWLGDMTYLDEDLVDVALEENKRYSIDLDGDGIEEEIRLKAKKAESSGYKYQLYVDYDKAKTIKGYSIACRVVDIDTTDKQKEICFYSMGPSNYVETFGIYTYTDNKLVKISKEMLKPCRDGLKIKGDGKVSSTHDYLASDQMGCYYVRRDYEYKNGKLVELSDDNIDELTNNSEEYEYKLCKKIDVYKSYNSTKIVKTLKKGTKLKIDKVYYTKKDIEDKTTVNHARIRVDDKVVGWIEIPSVYDEDGQWNEKKYIFEERPSWG